MVSNMSATDIAVAAPEPVLRLVPPTRTDDDLSTEELGARIVGLAGRLAAATCRWLQLVAEFDHRDGCASWGLASTAAWLAHTCALSRRTAFEHVRVARALAAHPALVTAMASGTLSYSQVRAITRAVRPGDTTTVDDLTQAARHCSIGQLETLVRGLRTCESDEEFTPDEKDYVRCAWTSDSRWRMNARLAPEQGALVESVIATLVRTEGLTRSEALVRMAEVTLAAVNDTEKPPRPLRGEEHAAIVVHVDAADIPAPPTAPPTETAPPTDTATDTVGAAEAPAKLSVPAGRLAEGPGLRWAVIERLLCHGRIRAAVHDSEGNIQHLDRSHRTVPQRLFRALLHRDHGQCTYPGCTSHGRLQAHHVLHWLWGGPTDLANLVLLCERHHRGHHDGDFTIRPLARAGFRFLRRDGLDLSRPPDRSVLAMTAPDVDEVHTAVRDDAATPRWDGTRMDRAFAISCLAEGRSRERARGGIGGRSTLTG